ncbi:MAG: hypothetical protein WC376_02860 [Candidatus Nanoarchaeia archaeon]|jgi:hypothetical protein
MPHRLPTREQFLEWYKIIYLENNLELFKKTSEYYSNEDKTKGIPKFSYKYYTKTEGSTKRYRYDEFMYIVNLIYNIYSKVKEAKTFEELIKKLYTLKLSEIETYVEKDLDRFYFKKNQFKENESTMIKLFLISKWLNLAPNKEYEPYFKKTKRLLDSVKFSWQFNLKK